MTGLCRGALVSCTGLLRLCESEIALTEFFSASLPRFLEEAAAAFVLRRACLHVFQRSRGPPAELGSSRSGCLAYLGFLGSVVVTSTPRGYRSPPSSLTTGVYPWIYSGYVGVRDICVPGAVWQERSASGAVKGCIAILTVGSLRLVKKIWCHRC